MKNSSALPGLAFALLLAGGCTNSAGPEFETRAARAVWTTRGPTSYSYTVSRVCECLPEWTGPVNVVVRNGIVESQHYVRTGVAVEPRYAHLFPNVEGLFANIDSARANDVARLDVTYDPTFGFPARISVDQVLQAADDEYTYVASAFVARP